MEPLYITLIAVCGAIILINLILFLFAFFVKKTAFGSRCDKNPLLKYFTADDFNLCSKQVDIAETGKGQFIRAVIYKKEDIPQKNDLIIFCHGMGPGHVAYTTEIAYFCNLGYTVLAPDYVGCNLSDGKSIKSFKSGVKSVVAAIFYADANFNFDSIFLVGHSWGGYSALCAAAETSLAEKVVAISAPDRPEKAIYAALLQKMPKAIAAILYPFISLVCGGKSAADAAEVSNAKTLLVHGDKDSVVPQSNAVYYMAKGKNINKHLVKGRRHNPYNTVQAEQKLAELTENLSKVKSGNVEEGHFENFDFKAATEEDIEVMKAIAQFLA